MQFTSYMLDVLTDSVYPARITIEDGIFKEIVPIQVSEETQIDVEGLMLPGFIDSHILCSFSFGFQLLYRRY